MGAQVILLVPMKQPPNRLRYWRETRSLSQQALADAVGCSKMQVSRFERGIQGVDLGWLNLFAMVLEVAPGDLLMPEHNPDAAQTEIERELLHRLRTADDTQKAQLARVSEALLTFADNPDGQSDSQQAA